MRTCCRTVYVLAFAVVLLVAVKGGLLTQTSGIECTSKPPSGTWLMDQFTPTLRDSPDVVRYARSVLFMNEVVENFYIGDGNGVYFLSDAADYYNGTLLDFHIAASFDPETCMLSGSYFRLRAEPFFPDVIEYIYDGVTMGGRYIFSGDREPGSLIRDIFPQFGWHNVSYIGNP